MNDLTLSLYVLLGAALVAAAVFLLTARARKQREEALAAFCAQNGYRLTIQKEPTARVLEIEGDEFQLSSSMCALESSADSGSNNWHRETELIGTRENPLRATFALHISQGSTDLERLPQWVRDAALSAMRAWLGDWARELSSVRTAFCEGGRTGVVFEPQEGAAAAALERLRVLLSQYHGGLPLMIESAPARVRIFLPDGMIFTVREAQELIQLVKAL